MARLLFRIPNLPRKELIVDDSVAEKVKTKIEDLIHAKKTGTQNREAELWFSQLPNGRVKQSIVRWGLVAVRADESHTLKEFKDVWLRRNELAASTLISYSRAFNTLISFFGGNTLLGSITKEDIARYITQLRTHLSSSSIGVHIIHLRSAFRYAIQLEWCQRNPFEDVKAINCRDESRVKYIDTETVVRVLDSIKSPRTKAILAFYRFAGARGFSELFNMRWDTTVQWSTETEPGYVLIAAEKTKRFSGSHIRSVPLHPKLEATLRLLRESCDSEYLFPGCPKNKPASPQLSRHFTNCGYELGVAYNLRRSFCSDMMECIGGVDPKAYATICGHSFATGMYYYQIMHPERLKKAYNVIIESWINK